MVTTLGPGHARYLELVESRGGAEGLLMDLSRLNEENAKPELPEFDKRRLVPAGTTVGKSAFFFAISSPSVLGPC